MKNLTRKIVTSALFALPATAVFAAGTAETPPSLSGYAVIGFVTVLTAILLLPALKARFGSQQPSQQE